ncbi:MAG: nucleoside triphosphate pyrophosphohydrolase [Christensenellales bacterium]|jgi:tetrapyrrole methylase family protein/MazG family protein
MIIVIGLGNQKGDLTINQTAAISKADKVVVKTAKTPTYTYFTENRIPVENLDNIYERATDFNDLDTRIVDYLTLLKEDNIVYCVNGSGYTDSSVAALSLACDIKILPGVGQEAPSLSLSPAPGYTVYSASDFLLRARNMTDTNLPLVIYEIYDKLTAQEIKIKLLEMYPADTKAVVCRNGKSERTELAEIDRQKKYDYSFSLCVIPNSFYQKGIYTFGDVAEIVMRLRDPGGCPWDRAQTAESIRENIIEEAYELVEAINLKDSDKIIEECGDVLLQAVFLSVICQAGGQFNLFDVTTGLAKKLISRHTHIFGKDKAHSEAEALAFWEQAKKKEKSQKTVNDAIAGVAQTFNSLMRAEKIQKIIKKTGFDFANAEEGLAKIYEELKELKEAKSAEEIENECGDLLFSAVNLLRLLGVNSEVALDKTTDKFIRRFEYVIKKAEEEGYNIYECPVEKMHEWYYQGKLYENL